MNIDNQSLNIYNNNSKDDNNNKKEKEKEKEEEEEEEEESLMTTDSLLQLSLLHAPQDSTTNSNLDLMKDNSIMSNSSISNEINVNGIMMDTPSLSGQDSNVSLLNTYLDTQVMQSLQMNNEIITVHTPTPTTTFDRLASSSSPLPLSPQTFASIKESLVDPISISSPSPLPNLPSSHPITQNQDQNQEQFMDQDLQSSRVIHSFNHNRLPSTNSNIPIISSPTPFSYKRKNEGKFKSKKIFDTISKKTCYWPTWIKQKR